MIPQLKARALAPGTSMPCCASEPSPDSAGAVAAVRAWRCLMRPNPTRVLLLPVPGVPKSGKAFFDFSMVYFAQRCFKFLRHTVRARTPYRESSYGVRNFSYVRPFFGVGRSAVLERGAGRGLAFRAAGLGGGRGAKMGAGREVRAREGICCSGCPVSFSG